MGVFFFFIFFCLCWGGGGGGGGGGHQCIDVLLITLEGPLSSLLGVIQKLKGVLIMNKIKAKATL